MSSPASIKNHPIHPLLITIPVGLFVFTLISDIVHLVNHMLVWTTISYYAILVGIIGGLVAAIFGFIDYLAITDAKTKVTATKHLIANLVVVALFVVNFVIRSNNPDSATVPFILTLVGVGILVYSGWLGGDMVYEHGMAVELDADGRLKKGRPKPYAERVPEEKPKAAIAEQRGR